MKSILVINGPNLGVLGKRPRDIYGSFTLAEVEEKLIAGFPEVRFDFFQSDCEGEIVGKILSALDESRTETPEAIIINAGAYSHTSLAIADAIETVGLPTVEVHISNIFAREPIRRQSLLAPVAEAVIAGCGLCSYTLAAKYLLEKYE